MMLTRDLVPSNIGLSPSGAHSVTFSVVSAFHALRAFGCLCGLGIYIPPTHPIVPTTETYTTTSDLRIPP